MTKVKICGLMRLEDISYVNGYQPDYAGFVFAPGRHQVDEEWVRGLKLFLDPEITTVGLFVNQPFDLVAGMCDRKTIDVVQLHGEEDEEYIEKLKEKTGRSVIKAVRVKTTQDILDADQLPCDYLLLDTYIKGVYGGSGQSFDLGLIPKLQKPYFLAGGLTSENIQEKIRSCHPFGVDTSSGVEGEDGWKDLDKVRLFISKAREEQHR